MIKIDKMEDYLTYQSSHDRFPEAYEVREIYNEKVTQLQTALKVKELEANELMERIAELEAKR